MIFVKKFKEFHLFSSLQTRILIMVILLLTLIVGALLMMIGKREVQAIYKEQIQKGIFISRYISLRIQDQFVLSNEEELAQEIQSLIDYELIYVVVYDTFGMPFASTRFIQQFEEIYQYSRLPVIARPDSYYSERKMLRFPLTGQILRIQEVEIPVFYMEKSQKWGSIKIGLSMEGSLKEITKTRLILLLIGSAGLLVGLIGAILLARHITNPVKKLVEGTNRVARGDFSHTIVIRSRDEIGELAQSFNHMNQQLQHSRAKIESANQRLVEAEKLASIGRMSAGIAHEIRNPLTSVKLNIQKVMGSDHLHDVEKEHLDISREGIRQIEIFIKELLNFTRISVLNLDYFSPIVIMDESIKMLLESLERKNIHITRNYREEALPVRVDADKIRQVFINLLRNASEAVDDGGSIEVAVSPAAENGRKWIRTSISDDGCGIPEKDWEYVFEPYYTTKASGFGLGLANARKIIEQHQGIIRVTHKTGGGTRFDILLPLEEEI
ncbi:MAG: HAMP domain-containing protein [Acidobacteria bacterium]|nr:HAMP domain-containing protein [Acidobacteriota bacterium]MCG2817207.1 ATP-binding protein [Candidatus Aminicenantes bacterium]MBU1337849.1 HAMP domain-containing protein [Acidobacteriota bacterium]MBU1474002.1 HAMP domain-containing protein [Acidobacteriota bacterium]MBU2437910.1 HAMP domain-containing protein [Acidobacteriota bacterium]